MTNEQNLKPFTMDNPPPSGEVAKKNGRKGGLQKAKNERINKTMTQIGQEIANCRPPTKELIEEAMLLFPDLDKEEISNKTLLMTKLFQEAIDGSLKAIEMFRDIIGEKEAEKADDAYDVRNIVVVTEKELEEEEKRMREALKDESIRVMW